MLNDNRVRVITGHYGSGKTEFAVNYTAKLAEIKDNVAIVDLDIVNPYFRSREKTELLEEMGVRVISSSVKGSAVDVPGVPAAVYTPLQDKSIEAVIDLGGDPAGATALGVYEEYFEEGDYDMLFVVNAYRPETQTPEKVIEYIRNIELRSKIKVTGLVNTTHMLKSTTVEDVLYGQELVEKVSEITNLPIKYVVALEHVAKDLPQDIQGEIFPIKLYMREEWMS